MEESDKMDTGAHWTDQLTYCEPVPNWGFTALLIIDTAGRTLECRVLILLH